ncbi:conserved hypothetical protein [Culex quinquefasciatus]|uniref:Uncharacterized protein n=1 Tax=Culex quinquefasciatus TaxID=7176 RepID=B0XIJ8_CULQU|nr:conserved hypothetical protein [Culex quinquefasciatus]|eukprot:XP_001869470.1 conserved hypothetical protein [Culex quinquefasciatus]
MTSESFNTSSTHNIPSQFSAAFSMEPGSRSPLPPTTQAQFIDLETPFRSMVASLDIPYPPNKPPRKTTVQQHNFSKIPESRNNISACNVSSVFIQSNHSNQELSVNTNSNSVPLSPKNDREYESVEDITDAWKKLGIDDVKHIESSLTMPESSSSATHSDSSYDKLDFFRTSHKASSGYKTIVPIKQKGSITQGSLSDDYEIVGDPPTSSTLFACNSNVVDVFDNCGNQMTITSPDTLVCRVADDSYQGYGLDSRARAACRLVAQEHRVRVVDEQLWWLVHGGHVVGPRPSGLQRGNLAFVQVRAPLSSSVVWAVQTGMPPDSICTAWSRRHEESGRCPRPNWPRRLLPLRRERLLLLLPEAVPLPEKAASVPQPQAPMKIGVNILVVLIYLGVNKNHRWRLRPCQQDGPSDGEPTWQQAAHESWKVCFVLRPPPRWVSNPENSDLNDGERSMTPNDFYIDPTKR